MKLAQKWDAHFEAFSHKEHTSNFWKARLREAFYAGAASAVKGYLSGEVMMLEMDAEIDDFKSRRTSPQGGIEK